MTDEARELLREANEALVVAHDEFNPFAGFAGFAAYATAVAAATSDEPLCRGCLNMLPPADFYTSNGRLHYHCKSCFRERMRRYRPPAEPRKPGRTKKERAAAARARYHANLEAERARSRNAKRAVAKRKKEARA